MNVTAVMANHEPGHWDPSVRLFYDPKVLFGGPGIVGEGAVDASSERLRTAQGKTMFDSDVRLRRARCRRPLLLSGRAISARAGRLSAVLMALACLSMRPFAVAQAAPLGTPQNPTLTDTGQVKCYDSVTRAQLGTVSSATPKGTITDDTLLRQDCTRGAAAADAMGVMVKHGGSTTKGRDYSKIGNDGSELASDATLGTGATDWACTKDNITGLIWEVKTADSTDLHYWHHTFYWYDPDPAVNGGNAGTSGVSYTTCGDKLPPNLCNTTQFRDTVNVAGLCGHNDWRLPTPKELQSIVDYNRSSPAIDTDWFPNTPSTDPYVTSSPGGFFWSGVSYAADATVAWGVNIADGTSFMDGNKAIKARDHAVRLVRGGQ